MEDNITLKGLKLDFQKLVELGFVKGRDYYKYENKIINNQFLLIIKISEDNSITSDIIEITTNEKFMPYYIRGTSGDFTGKIREEYNNIIEKLKNNCCYEDIFKSEYAKLIIKYIKEKYNDELEYLWEKFPNNAIWRNKENNKWYGALLTVQKSKIGVKEEGSIEIIDLLLEQDKIEKLVDNEKIFTGYHMNKKHWITIKLDGSVNIKKIYKLIDNSYNLSTNK